MNFKVIKTGASHFLTKRFLGPFWYRRRWLDKTQWLKKDELERIQLQRLQKLVAHCYKTVPYYRELMDKLGFGPNDIKGLEDIKRFPVLSKQDVLEAGNSIVSTKYPKFLLTTGLTGGTTGTPLSLPRNLFAVENEHAFVRRQWDWAGLKFSDNTAYLSGRVIADPNQKEGQLYAYDPFMRELILSTYHLSVETARQYAQAVLKYKVKALVGYTSSICFFARACMDMEIDIKLKAALTTSETISDQMRETISKAFGCQVFDFYGAAERVCYIYTCEKGSYHIIPEYGYTELVPTDDGVENKYGVIATGFWNWAMPLVRYNTNDTLIKTGKSCSCGREFEVVDSISGRTGDVIRTPLGKEYAPTLLARVAKGAHNLLASQIIQDRIDHLRILYVPNDEFSETDLEHFKKHMHRYLPDELQMEFEKVEEVEKTKNGKMNFLVSKL